MCGAADHEEGSIDNEDDDGSEQIDSDNNEEDGSDEGSDRDEAVEDEVSPRITTVGDVPLEWYKDEKHIGYDITKKIFTKKEKQDRLDSFLATMVDSTNWRKIIDDYNDEEVELTKKKSKMVRRLLEGEEAPHADFDPYADFVDWFKWTDAIHPLSSAPEPK